MTKRSREEADAGKLHEDANEIAFRTVQAAIGEAEKPIPPEERTESDKSAAAGRGRGPAYRRHGERPQPSPCAGEVGRPVKRFLDLAGVWIKTTEGDRVCPVADPYETGNERAQNVDPIENLPELRGGYGEDERGEVA